MKKHLFFDMDNTIAPSRQLILPEMFELLSNLSLDIIIVSGQSVDKIKWQSNNLPATVLGQNGNHAIAIDGKEIWNVPLTPEHKSEINEHINKLLSILDHDVNPDWNPIEDRGAQITFSPIGNTAPVEIKMVYDPDRKKREELLKKVPFESSELTVKFGGSTSLDYFHAKNHKGANVQKLIELMGWQKDDCIYYGDGLFPGGNDESVIGVIETVPVKDHLDTFDKLKKELIV
jgi:HAD superfamily hydrolase (TIGR01484 family)